MLVYALSGSQWLRRIDPPEIGWADVEMVATDPLFDGLPNPWRTFVHHYDEVLSPPPPWRTLGRTRCCPTHVLRYGDRPIWGIQAHPEISTRSARFFLRLSLVLGAKPARSLLPAVRQSPPHHPIAGMIVRRFLAMEHGAPAG